MIEIDGAHGEGGGQIVRTAACLAALTGKSCRIFDIRQGRRQPGLRLQHTLAVRALAEFSRAGLKGDRVGSRELEFRPGNFLVQNLRIPIATAASITLMLQALMPAALSAPRPVTIVFDGGATDTAFSPTLDYFRHVFLWFMRAMGVDPRIDVARRGYYPPGGARVTATIEPARPRPLRLTSRGALRAVTIFSSAAEILGARDVAQRQAASAAGVLAHLAVPIETRIGYEPSLSAGSSLCAVARFENALAGADALGARGKTAEQVGTEAAGGLLRELAAPGCLDRHMADQILPYLAIAAGGSEVSVCELTEHCRTNMWVIERFIAGRFEVHENLIRWSI